MAGTLNSSIVVRVTHTPAGDTNETYTMVRPVVFQDAVVIATSAGADFVTIRNGAVNAISSDMAPGGDTNLARTNRAFTAFKSLAVGDVLTADVSAGNLAYESYIWLSAPGVAG